MADRARGKTKRPAKAKSKEEKSQRERFIEAARELGVDESGAEFEQIIARIIPAKPKAR